MDERHLSCIPRDDIWLYNTGHARKAWLCYGCRFVPELGEYRFVVWAPNAQAVSLTGDFNAWGDQPMERWIDLTPLLGTSSTSLTYLSIEASPETVASLGLESVTPANDPKHPAVVEAGSKAFIQFGRLYIHPTKIGSGKFVIRAVGGGSALGGGDNPPGGMEITRTLSIIARDAADGGNGNGGWL